jgi:hypothetical protein
MTKKLPGPKNYQDQKITRTKQLPGPTNYQDQKITRTKKLPEFFYPDRNLT